MFNINISRDKLIKLSAMGIAYNILDFYYMKDSQTYKYFKMYKIVLQERPKLLCVKGVDLIVLGKISKYKNTKILLDLTGDKLRDILDMNPMEVCCDDKKYFHVLLSENLKPSLRCSECIGKIPNIARIDNKLLNYLQDTSDSIANYVDIELFIASIIFCVDTRGWVYNKEDSSNNTSLSAWNLIMKDVPIPEKYIQLSKEYIRVFNDVIFPNKKEEFNIAIKILLDNKYLSYRSINTVCFLYKKVHSHINNNSTCFVGTLNEMFKDTVTLKDIRSTDTRYGSCNIYEFDYVGNNLTWLTNIFVDLKINKRYNVLGIIKKHSIYQGIKQSQIKINSLEECT